MRGTVRLGIALCAAAGVAAAVASPARAITIGFDCLTGTSAVDCAIGESQLGVELTDLGGGVVRFLFRNAGTQASVLSEVYFDDGSLLALSTVVDGPGVDFEPDANPPNLPGGENAVPPFQVTEGFLAQSVPSTSMNGVGPGEWVAIDFALQSGRTIEDVIAQLGTGELRIGLHVIAFASGGSESFLNAPEPEAALLLVAALLALAAWFARRSEASRRAPTASARRPSSRRSG